MEEDILVRWQDVPYRSNKIKVPIMLLENHRKQVQYILTTRCDIYYSNLTIVLTIQSSKTKENLKHNVQVYNPVHGKY